MCQLNPLKVWYIGYPQSSAAGEQNTPQTLQNAKQAKMYMP